MTIVAQSSPEAAAPRSTLASCGSILAAATAALIVTSALTPPAEARGGGFGGGGFGGGMHLGGGSLRSMGTSSFKSETRSISRHVEPKFLAPKVALPRKIIEPKQVFIPKKVFKQETTQIAHVVKAKPHVEPAPRVQRIVKHVPVQIAKPVTLTKRIDVNAQPLHKSRLLPAAGAVAGAAALHTLANGKPKIQPVRLTADHYLKAKVVDLHGHKYDAAKKMWWDGKHWWRGLWAWLFIDGVWYYGNQPWVQADGGWSAGSANAPVCVDCGGGPGHGGPINGGPVKTADGATATVGAMPKPATSTDGHTPAVSGQGSGAAPVQVSKVAFEPLEAAANRQAKPVTKIEASTSAMVAATAAVCPSLPAAASLGFGYVDATGSLSDRDAGSAAAAVSTTPCDPPAAGTATVAAAAPTAKSLQVAEASLAVLGGSPGAATTIASGAPATECRQFVPAIGMTIEVPCAD